MSPAIATDLAINLAHVSKVYKGTWRKRGHVHALRGIELRVNRGEIFGLLGPNGAGKSTLVKILLTVISPTRAEGTLLSHRVGHKPTLAHVGYLPEHHRFPEYLTGAQVVDFFGAMALTPRRERRMRTAELLRLVGMADWENKRIKSYSKGMRQRIGIAQALVNDPDLIVLDEPTDGVDPVGRRDIRNVLAHLKSLGKTVFLNSHLLSELEMVCDRVAILVQGLVSAQGTIDELTRDQQRYEIEIAVDDPAAISAAAAHALPDAGVPNDALAPRAGWSGQLSTGELVQITKTGLSIGTTDALKIQPVIDRLRGRGYIIRSLRPVRPSLEDLFMQAVTDPVTGEVLAPGAARHITPEERARP